MTTDVWDPSGENNNKSYVIDNELLSTLIFKIDTIESNDITTLLDSEAQQKHKMMMSLGQEQWNALENRYSDSEILSLIRFFTLAEVQYSGWTAEEKSPVIWLAKILRKRGKSLDKTFLQWIKSVNPNKFLPFGPL